MRRAPAASAQGADPGIPLEDMTLKIEIKLSHAEAGPGPVRILRWFAEAGAAVKKGQPLFEIDSGGVTTTVAAAAEGRLADPASSQAAILPGATVGFLLPDGEGLPPAGPMPSSPPKASPKPANDVDTTDVVKRLPHDMMRRAIARRLTESKQTVPHFYLSVDCDLGALLALREEINAAAEMVDGKPSWRVSVNDFMIKATAAALARVPAANVTWTDDALLYRAHADIAVAVAIPSGGLMTPVLRQVETKSLQTISAEMKDLAARAKTRRLKPEEYRGGTVSISNLGMFGVLDFSAIINPPHAAILAIGAGEERIVVRNHQPAVATMMTVTLSVDHRAVDGAVGAELLAAFRTAVEKPADHLT